MLLDGESLSTSKIGELNANHIPANMIEKVEFIRGHRASVYGANAVLGVINKVLWPLSRSWKERLCCSNVSQM